MSLESKLLRPHRLGGAEGSFLCSLITDFLAEGAGWGASPGPGGELGCLLISKAGLLKGRLKRRLVPAFLGGNLHSKAMFRRECFYNLADVLDAGIGGFQ